MVVVGDLVFSANACRDALHHGEQKHEQEANSLSIAVVHKRAAKYE
jgi:hypothetical protein